MATRKSSRNVVFKRPFILDGMDALQPAGTYRVETEEKGPDTMQSPAGKRIRTMMHIASSGSTKCLPVNPEQLHEALTRDGAQQDPTMPLSSDAPKARHNRARTMRRSPRFSSRKETMNVTIYHNPQCGTSCNALANIRKLGHEPRIVEYLQSPLSRADILALIAQMGVTTRHVVRRKEALFQELGLGEKDVTEDELLDALVEHPILINRPIVVVEDGAKVSARLCRPSALVASLLEPTAPNS